MIQAQQSEGSRKSSTEIAEETPLAGRRSNEDATRNFQVCQKARKAALRIARDYAGF